MQGKISYKSDIEEVKSKIYDNYMQVAVQLVNMESYKKAKKHAYMEILEYAFVHFLVIVLLIKQTINSVSDYYFIFTIISLILLPLFTFFVATYQNYKFTKKIKRSCVRAILRDLSDVEYFEYKDVPDKPCIIDTEDVRNLSIISSYAHKNADDIIVGKYNDTEYNFQDISVYRAGKKGGEEFRGAAVKTSVDTGIAGWVEIASKKITDKIISVKAGMTVTFIVLLCYIIGLHKYINKSPHYLVIYCSLVVLALIVSYLVGKLTNSIGKITYKSLDTPTVLCNTTEINEKYSIRTSESQTDIDKVVTSELCAVFDKIMQLYGTNEVLCRFYSDNVILLISSYPNFDNLFEIGGLFSSPISKKISEKFVSQMAGILIFMDYITSNFNKAE